MTAQTNSKQYLNKDLEPLRSFHLHPNLAGPVEVIVTSLLAAALMWGDQLHCEQVWGSTTPGNPFGYGQLILARKRVLRRVRKFYFSHPFKVYIHLLGYQEPFSV